MRLYTPEESRQLDHWAIQELGIPAASLMENAGYQVAMAMEEHWGALTGKYVSIICGKGNNGGDGLVLARHLANQGCRVQIYLLEKPENLAPLAAQQAAIGKSMGLRFFALSNEQDLAACHASLAQSNILVDAILGTGSRGAVVGFMAKVLVYLNSLGRPLVAVDIPTGLDAAAGQVEGACAYASLTVTFACAKPGLLIYPGASYVGKLVVADIGIPPRPDLCAQERFFVEAAELKPLLPTRPLEAHKRSVGSALLIVGSQQYSGAAILAAHACQRAGVGMLHLAVPAAIAPLLQAQVPEAVVHAMGSKENPDLQEKDLDSILELAKNCQAALVGPGLHHAPGTYALAQKLYAALPLPAVFDADGLNALSQWKGSAPQPRILTPHSGEMARLSGLNSAQVNARRLQCATQCARQRQAVVLLKGPHTIVAEPTGAFYVNSTGNPGLATAGSGDVLSGIITGLLAQGLGASQAARLGAYLHGLAADLLAQQRGELGIIAGDIAATIPAAWAHLAKS